MSAIGMIRGLLAVVSALIAALGVAIGWDVGGGRAAWPLPEGPMGYRFVASILLAEATVMAWFALPAADLRASRGGALGFAAMNAGLAWQMASSPATSVSAAWALGCGLIAAGSLGLWWFAGRVPPSETLPLPPVVRGAFLAFAIALAVAVVMLLGRASVVFPWPLAAASSTAFGWMFLASALYFFDGWLRPSRANAVGQLAGFLVYDLVLIVPWLAHFERARGPFLVSLVIYVTVLAVSAALAAYYLPRWLGSLRNG